MKKVVIICLTIYFGTAILLLKIFGGEGDGRQTYDTLMHCINCFVFFAVIIKFGKEPIRNMLKGTAETLTHEIKKLEEFRSKTLEKVNETKAIVAEGDEKLAIIKERIVNQGKKEKEAIIESARKQSVAMITAAQKRLENYMVQSRNKLLAEIIDLAITKAAGRLPAEISTEDGENLINKFLEFAK